MAGSWSGGVTWRDRALERTQGPVGAVGVRRDGEADSLGVAERAARRDDHAGALKAARELRAADAGRGEPEHVRLALGDAEPGGRRALGEPRALDRDRGRATGDDPRRVAQRFERARLRELVDAELGLELRQQRLGARA